MRENEFTYTININPNPKCRSCAHFHFVSTDGYSGLVGTHFLCKIPQDAIIEGYTALYPLYDECVIDEFYNGCGECKFYLEIKNENNY